MENCTPKELKRLLREYGELSSEIDNQSERLNRLIDRLTNVGVQVLSDMPKAPQSGEGRMADDIATKIEIEENISKLISERKRMRKWIEELTKMLKDPNERCAIRARYIDSMSWSDVSNLVFGGKEDYLEKEDSYLRRMHRIHGTALMNMSEAINKNNIPIFEVEND